MEVLKALNFDVWTFILMAINLLIVIGFLYKFLYQPVGRILAEREQRIAGSLEEAQKAREEASALLAKYEEQISNAKNEAQEIISRATKLGESMKEQILAEAREEAGKTLARAKAEIEGEKAKALAEIRGEIAGMVIMAAGKVIERELSLKDHEKLLKEFVAGVGEVQ
jgi:F-type H+-transporting ATPase subunit b